MILRFNIGSQLNGLLKLGPMKTNKSAIMLNVNMDSGHGGSSGRFDRIKEIALIYAFAIKVANVETE